MTISLVLFSARHCLFPARFRLAYYRAPPLPLPRCSSPFSAIPLSPAFSPSFASRTPLLPRQSPSRFLAGLSRLRSVCLRRASARRPTACPSVDGDRSQLPTFRRFTVTLSVHDNRLESDSRLYSALPGGRSLRRRAGETTREHFNHLRDTEAPG